ncbi:germination protein, Ger(x)C family [Caminicella sporogenes DSM 14501]|uniref:Germination protein, Ger(X)C family n=1 Tax=Caminicella sporogenes DSM 14501 TaxID=1121266 RepID=A0A1M6QL84_9FIRM|nr:Ger(x)C family spore germination protein [Caminicella sporogenes]RKD25271.1 hypothetical protein BET04_03385 [Caminicella sporogenes]SHK21049.1 germination protein, Ger(x)C family [Caminicella sporogenes DSM 14501]
MLKKYKSIILLIIFSILLTGCWDFEDISRRSILLSIGVDKIENKIEFITEIASLTSLLASGKEDKTQTTNVYITSSKGKDFEEARLYLNRAIPFPLFLGATRVVIFSKNLAKEGIEPYLNRIDNIYDYRKTLLPVVSHDAPKDLYKLKIIKDISVGFLIEDIIYHLKKNGMALYPNVGEVLSNIAFGKIGFLLPYIGVNKNTIEYLGLAVFKNAKFIGVISIEKTDGVLYLLSKYPTFVESIVSPDEHKNNKFSFKVKIKKRKFKTNYSKENKQIVIDVDLNLIAELRYRYYIQDFSKKYAQTLEKEISKKVKNEIKEVIEMSQKDFKCDIFSFAKYFKAQHPKIYESIDWEKNYPEIKFNINVKTKIINLGSIEKEIKKKI